MAINGDNLTPGAALLEEPLQSFVDSYLNSLLAWDIILFLYHRDAKNGRVGDVADHLDRPYQEVQSVFSHFYSSGLVMSEESESAGGYTVATTFSKEVEPFVAALDQRQLRLAILAAVLKREYTTP